MGQEDKRENMRGSGLRVLDGIVLLIFVAVLVVGLLPQLDLRTVRQRTHDRQTELDGLQKQVAKLAQDRAAAEIELENAQRRLQEESTLAERAKAAHETEETLRKQALADRLIQEGMQRGMSQTNHLLSIEIGTMRQEMAWYENQESEMKARTNTLTVAIQAADIRLSRLRQEEVDTQARVGQLQQDIATMNADYRRLAAESTRVDAELKQEHARLNTAKAANDQEALRVAKLQEDVAKVDAELAAARDALKQAQAALKLEDAALKEARRQVDAVRADAVAYAGLTEMAKKELATLQRQNETVKAEGLQAQAEMKRLQVDIATEEAKVKKAQTDMLKGREAETAARLGEVAARQRMEDARSEEGVIRKNIEMLRQNLAELQRVMQATPATAEKQP